MSKCLLFTAWVALYACLCGFVVVGHRGDPLQYPEETFQGDSAAFAAGADYVELDVQESSDGVLVIQHDPTLKRTTGANVAITAATFQQIQQYHTKNGEPIHSLQALFAHYQQTDTKFLIETKIEKGVPHPQMEAKIAALVNTYHMQDRVMFHSFSLSSLKRLQTLLPSVPRIFIVGSLKRINFAVFPYVTGINVSSDLVSAKLVSDLHHIGQKVYVWDEMNENQKKWRWLSNLPIDGVVTNYPKLAHTYQSLTREAQVHPVDTLATNTNTSAIPIYTNPYQPTVRKQKLSAQAVVNVQKAIRSEQTTYYQIGTNAFVEATTLNLAPLAGWAQLLLGQKATVTPAAGWQVTTRQAPQQSSARLQTLANGQQVQILAVKLHGSTVWCQTANGWLTANQLQLQPQLNEARCWFLRFHQAHGLQVPKLGLGQTRTGVLNAHALDLTLY
ncbi:glycerophosphodiester phosphodiesterase [Lacticaseibacillus baoqingensis]|uniref:Glycerophosphodiester phosphodiesterase n=1 Tax=Lacticaseibacillus baoqingensis TaxID=2486013 RepID=A0ABW4EAY3_9LACO|nr:glycerophosphodiester phosphodiesterase [Lacticaseibacillus baoqingensis]